MSNDARNVLRAMLHENPNKRPSAVDLLKHNWFKVNRRRNNAKQSLVRHMFDNFYNYNAELKFQQAAMAFIVHHLLSADEMQKYRNIFYLFNESGSGSLSHKEIVHGFIEYCKVKVTEKELMAVIKRVDADKSGEIDFEEFIRAIADKSDLLTDERLRMAFDMFDLDRGGTIASDELQNILGLNAKFSKAVWLEIANQFENGENSEINFEEFRGLMHKLL